MAPHYACAARVCFCEADWNPPSAKPRDRWCNEPELPRSVRVMAYLAGAPLIQFVHMDVMDIYQSVAKPGVRFCQPVVGDLTVVAAKAEGKIVLGKRHVEIGIKETPQQTRVRSAVGRMAGIAVPLRNRAMDRFALEHAWVMAEKTELGAFASQHELYIALVRIMAACAVPFLNRGVGIFAFERSFIMAHETEPGARQFELGLVLALMNIVACQTIARADGAMNKLQVILAFVTLVTEA